MKDNTLNFTYELLKAAQQKNTIHFTTEDQYYDGRVISIEGNPLVNFGSYSYLGLEIDQRLKVAAMEAIQQYGIQYPSSRSYVSCSLYTELEKLMQQMFQANVVLVPTTTLAHQTVIPVITEEGDAIIMDQQVHSSVQYAVNHMQLKGVRVFIVRHNNLEQLEEKIKELAINHKKIWYACDGVYSMYGDCAPLKKLTDLLNTYKQFHLYVDDAHGMSWIGKNGTGYALSQIALHPKMILTTSLNKAFAAGGSVIVFPDGALADKVNMVGGPLIFAGQHQNAALGAGIACSKIHLSPEIYDFQEELALKTKYCEELLEAYQLPVLSDASTPIFFVGLGLIRVGYNLLKRMKDRGYLANLSIFPAVPEACAGVRFSITRHLSFEDIKSFIHTLSEQFHIALQEEGRSLEDIYRAFKRIKTFTKEKERHTPIIHTPKYAIQHEKSIQTVPEKLWNGVLGDSKGMFDWNGLQFLENAFKNNTAKENNWDFRYYFVRDKNGKLVVATFFTTALVKEDMLAPIAISEQVENKRLTEPYYLSTKGFMMGSLFSAGQHLYINRTYQGWKDALMLLLDEVWHEQEKQNTSLINLRDFNADDTELYDFFTRQGFVQVKMPDTHIIENFTWGTKEGFLNQFDNGKKKYNFKKEVFEYEQFYDVEVLHGNFTTDIDHLYSLYRKVKDKSFELNTFPLPKTLFENMQADEQWEIIQLRLKHLKDAPVVGVSFNYKTKENYNFLLVGMNYDYIKPYNLYKQIIWQTLLRARALNKQRFILGLTASDSKRKFGAKPIAQVAYIQTKDNYSATIMNAMVNISQVSLTKS